ncbi:MAG: hypothetical protein GTN76_11385 [Candidatus Aenigmarchaeota archaeon]|nr:hypothetical protein [Candidatus Aenigmarchaeota archaeon]NIQ18031.1 hypothetical protein [Candidatus Aenigmarchaeota archaeon]
MSYSKTDGVILLTFIIGIISIVYFITTLSLIGSDPMLVGIPESYLSWMVFERLVIIGIIIIVLILITYILLRQKNFEELERSRPEEKAKRARSEKEIREDMQRYYRDLGALKIVFKDGALDAKTYNERKKYLDDMIKKRKKQLENLKK